MLSSPSAPVAFSAHVDPVEVFAGTSTTFFVRLHCEEQRVIGARACCVCGASEVCCVERVLVGERVNRRYLHAGLCRTCRTRRARQVCRRALGVTAFVGIFYAVTSMALSVVGGAAATSLLTPVALVAIVIAGGPFVAATPVFPGARWTTEGDDILIELPRAAVIALAPQLEPHLTATRARIIAQSLNAHR